MSPEDELVMRKDWVRRGFKDPRRAFLSHRGGAKQRGIEFLMTFEEWWGIWSDYYHLRGKGTNGLCMGRFHDVGPYAVGNVYLTTNLGNIQDRVKPPKKEYNWEDHRELWAQKSYGNPKAVTLVQDNYVQQEKKQIDFLNRIIEDVVSGPNSL